MENQFSINTSSFNFTNIVNLDRHNDFKQHYSYYFQAFPNNTQSFEEQKAQLCRQAEQNQIIKKIFESWGQYFILLTNKRESITLITQFFQEYKINICQKTQGLQLVWQRQKTQSSNSCSFKGDKEKKQFKKNNQDNQQIFEQNAQLVNSSKLSHEAWFQEIKNKIFQEPLYFVQLVNSKAEIIEEYREQFLNNLDEFQQFYRKCIQLQELAQNLLITNKQQPLKTPEGQINKQQGANKFGALVKNTQKPAQYQKQNTNVMNKNQSITPTNNLYETEKQNIAASLQENFYFQDNKNQNFNSESSLQQINQTQNAQSKSFDQIFLEQNERSTQQNNQRNNSNQNQSNFPTDGKRIPKKKMDYTPNKKFYPQNVKTVQTQFEKNFQKLLSEMNYQGQIGVYQQFNQMVNQFGQE